jgi:hypothetical protein
LPADDPSVPLALLATSLAMSVAFCAAVPNAADGDAGRRLGTRR